MRIPLVALLLLLPGIVRGDLITFGTAADYTTNFVKTFDSAPGNNLNHNAAGQNIRLFPTALPGTGIGVLRYTPGGQPGPLYLTEPLGLDFNAEGSTGTPTAGVMTRIQASGLGIFAFYGLAGAVYTFGLAYDVATSGAGTGIIFWQADVNPVSGGLFPRAGFSGGSAVPGTPNHLVLTQTSGVNPTFRLTLSNTSGFVATSDDILLDATTDYSSAGRVGIRMLSSGSAITADNFSVTVPEPATLAFVLVGASALLGRRRRHRGNPCGR